MSGAFRTDVVQQFPREGLHASVYSWGTLGIRWTNPCSGTAFQLKIDAVVCLFNAASGWFFGFSNLYFCKREAKNKCCSWSEKLFPMHSRFPSENGRYENRCCPGGTVRIGERFERTVERTLYPFWSEAVGVEGIGLIPILGGSVDRPNINSYQLALWNHHLADAYVLGSCPRRQSC